MASTDEAFRSPETSSHLQVMSQTRFAAFLIGGLGMDAAASAGQADGGDTRSCVGADPEEIQRLTGLGGRQRVAGVNGATHAVGTGSPNIRQPLLHTGTPQPQMQQPTTQPQQVHLVPPQLHQAQQPALNHEPHTPQQQATPTQFSSLLPQRHLHLRSTRTPCLSFRPFR